MHLKIKIQTIKFSMFSHLSTSQIIQVSKKGNTSEMHLLKILQFIIRLKIVKNFYFLRMHKNTLFNIKIFQLLEV